MVLGEAQDIVPGNFSICKCKNEYEKNSVIQRCFNINQSM